MYHLVARSQPGTLLFHDHLEAHALWTRLTSDLGLLALCLMPDHVHLLHRADVRQAVAQRLAAYARWRNHHRGDLGSVFVPLPRAEVVPGDQKKRRSERYVYLNPCRSALVDDPLEWPWSSYRDAVGLAAAPVCRKHANASGYHRYVSSDPTVHVSGTLLPGGQLGRLDAHQVLDAVSAVYRLPVATLGQRGPLRVHFLSAARSLCDATPDLLASMTGCSPRTVRRAADLPREALALVRRVATDPRFPALHDGDLRRQARWRRYRSYR